MYKETKKSNGMPENYKTVYLHANWRNFVALCEKMDFGEIEHLKIQDGLPMVAEIVKKKFNFSKREGSL